MYKVIAFLRKRKGLNRSEFTTTTRTGMHLDPRLRGGAAFLATQLSASGDFASDEIDFDVMTEVGFADRESFLAWNTRLDSLPKRARTS